MADPQRPAGFVPDGFVPDTAAPRKPAATEDYLPAPTSFLDSAKNFAGNFAHNLDPRTALKLMYDTTEGIGSALSGNLEGGQALKDDLKGMGQAQLDQFKKGYQAYKQGRISEAVGHTLAGAMPLVGPAAANAGEQIGSGDISGGLGSSAGLLAPMVAAPAIAKLPTSIGARGLNPVAESSVQFGRAHGIPIDAATATNSPAIATIQKRVGDTMGGAGTAERFKARQAQGLATVGEQLAAKASPIPTTTEQAGIAAQQGVRDVVHGKNVEATTAYEKLRSIEADPKHIRQVQTGTQTAADGTVTPVIEAVPLPVDLRAAKQALKPAADRLIREGQIAPLMGEKATAARALDRLMSAPDHAPLSVVDAALGELKTFARADNPDLRSIGQGVVANAVSKLGDAVNAAAASAGPEAVRALKTGREATTAKYVAADVLKGLETGAGEPVAAFKRLTAPGDSAITQLRELATQAPQAVPKIARAVLDGMLQKAGESGGFDHADRLAADWNKLGTRTKATLFPDPQHLANLNDFFRLAKKIAENPNPSGTARVNNIFNATSTLVGYPVAKLLYSPAGVKLLTEGYRIPLQSAVAVTKYSARLAAALRAQAGLQPAMAADSQEPTPATIGRR